MSAIGEDGPAAHGDKGEQDMDGAAAVPGGRSAYHATDHQ